MQNVMLTDHASGEPLFIDIQNSLQFSIGLSGAGSTRVFVTRFSNAGPRDEREFRVREDVAQVEREMIAAGARSDV